MSLDAILSRIAGGDNVSSGEILSYLCLERREQRAEINFLLAKAHLESGREEHLRRAGVFIQRAWLLSRFSADLLPLYVDIHSALDDIPAIREAYKRVGIEAASRGDVSEAIRYFDLWQYAYYTFKNLDKYDYDFDILECIDQLARPHRISPKPRAGLLKGGKMRVAYLVKGITELGSILVKINLLFARHHDRSWVEPIFFVPESERTVLASEAGREHVRLFEQYGYELMTAPDADVMQDRLLAVASMIHDARPDVLVVSAALTQFQHYYITSLRPAPFVVGLVQGPPEQFAPPELDYGIAWSKHPLIDSPINCTLMDMELELPDRSQIVPHDKREFDVPNHGVIIATAGRHVKFQEPELWRAVIELLNEHPHLYYLAMGVEETQVPFLPQMLPREVRSRIRFLPWRGDDYLKRLCLTDILIDTFPSGGGAILSDAMALGVPIVTFKNNYMRRYDQTDWSPAEEFIHIETVVARGDFAQMKHVASRLINDEQYRRDVGRRLQEHIRRTRGNPPRAVRKCENAYAKILENLSGDAAPGPLEMEVEMLMRASGRHGRTPRWVARAMSQLKRALRFGIRMLDRIA